MVHAKNSLLLMIFNEIEHQKNIFQFLVTISIPKVAKKTKKCQLWGTQKSDKFHRDVSHLQDVLISVINSDKNFFINLNQSSLVLSFQKYSSWIFVPGMMVYSHTNSVNFPAKNLDRGRIFIQQKKRVKTVQTHSHYSELSELRPEIIIVSLKTEVHTVPIW